MLTRRDLYEGLLLRFIPSSYTRIVQVISFFIGRDGESMVVEDMTDPTRKPAEILHVQTVLKSQNWDVEWQDPL